MYVVWVKSPTSKICTRIYGIGCLITWLMRCVCCELLLPLLLYTYLCLESNSTAFWHSFILIFWTIIWTYITCTRCDGDGRLLWLLYERLGAAVVVGIFFTPFINWVTRYWMVYIKCFNHHLMMFNCCCYWNQIEHILNMKYYVCCSFAGSWKLSTQTRWKKRVSNDDDEMCVCAACVISFVTLFAVICKTMIAFQTTFF